MTARFKASKIKQKPGADFVSAGPS